MRICLLGNNLTNLVLANVLANKKLNIDIYYNSNLRSQKSHTSRTLAISPENLIFLKANNKKFKISAWPSEKIKIYVESNKEKELFEFKSNSKKNFFLIKYYEIYNFYLNNLKKNNFVNFVKIKKNNYRLIHKKNYNLIINSEAKSHLTKKFFNKKIEKKYNSTAYTFIIFHKKLKNNIATQIFTKNGPLAFLPLSNNQTSIVFSYKGLYKVDFTKIKKILGNFNTKYKIIRYGELESFGLKFSTLRKYYYKNILSFGDLIHKIHPLAGQGFNMTIRDIKILSTIIDKKIDLGLEIDSSVADNFEKKTKHINLIYGSSIDFIYKFFNFDNKLNNSLSYPLFKIFKKNNFLNNYATYFSDKGIDI